MSKDGLQVTAIGQSVTMEYKRCRPFSNSAFTKLALTVMPLSRAKQSLLQSALSADANDSRILMLKQSLADACTKNYNVWKSTHQCKLPCSDAFVTCVHWQGGLFISGADIAKIVAYRLQCQGIKVPSLKKLQEGVVSDLRVLRAGQHFVLENAQSELLRLLRRNGCIKTLKKQKVFFWDSVPHDALFENALEREVMRVGVSNMSGSSECTEGSSSDSSGVEGMRDPEVTYEDMPDLFPAGQLDTLLDGIAASSTTHGERMAMDLFDSGAFLREIDTKDYSSLAY